VYNRMVQAMYTAYGSTPNGTAATKDVTTSATDTTTGRLLKVGDFGIYSHIAATGDWDTYLTSGIYRGLSLTNAPTNDWIIVEVYYFSGIAFQRATSLYWDRIYHRNYSSNTWSPWVKIYHTGNLLGTVSQSGGVPTGAVIEAGSNANGSYTKFADGTMICRSEGASVHTSTWSIPNKFNNYGSINFASAFISNTITISLSLETTAIGSSGRQYASQYSTPSVGSVANVSFEFLGTVSGYSVYVTVLAIGRWF